MTGPFISRDQIVRTSGGPSFGLRLELRALLLTLVTF